MLQVADPKALDDFLPVEKFAELCEVTPRTIERWLQERKIDSVKLGGAIKIPKLEYLRLVATGYRTRSL
jgi:excisionase family DNA binding protein